MKSTYFWAKGVLAEALKSASEQRWACLVHVASVCTSQIDSQAKRPGDRFYHASGDVSQADANAALNVLEGISILLERSPAQLSVKRVELQADYSACQPTADKFYDAHICARS